jgi:enoyl-CoA hydratase
MNERRLNMSVLIKELDDDGILTITINRPDKLNALNSDVLNSLAEMTNQAKQDNEVKAILLTGSGKAFCAGADINRLAECNAETGYQFAQHGQAVFRQVETLGKPVLAAINGFAFGGGCELAMSAHLRIASAKAQFGQPEVKLGVIPGYGGTQRLSRLIGKGRALDLCLTGRFIDAQTALNWGLVTEIVADDNLVMRAKQILLSVTSLAPLAIRATMEVIDKGYDMSLDDALHLEAVHFGLTCATSDKKEGVNAFLEKRTPAFKGA